MKINLLSICLFVVMTSHTWAQRTYYVSPTGLDSAPGSNTQPTNFTHLESSIVAGDVVIFKDGIYTFADDVYLYQKGDGSADIILKAENVGKAILVGPNNPNKDDFSKDAHEAVFYIFECKRVVIDGLVFTHASGSADKAVGLQVRRTDFITVRNCTARDNGGGGISIQSCDNILIEDNVCTNNASRSPYNESGISLYGLRPRTTSGSYWGAIVRRNLCYHNYCELNFYIPSLGAFFDKPTDGNGIIIDQLDNVVFNNVCQIKNADGSCAPPYGKRVLVENNVCYDNGGKGITSFASSQVRINNNTVYHNNWVLARKDSETYEIAMLGQLNQDHQGVHSNVAIANPAHKKDYAMGIEGNPGYTYGNYLIGAGTRIVNYKPVDSQFSTDNTVRPIAEQNATIKLIKPSIDATVADFRPSFGSPLLNAYQRDAFYPTDDKDKVTRPQGQYADLGAYEYVYMTSILVSPAQLNLNADVSSELLVSFSPANATGESINWASSNSDVATVSPTGMVTAITAGTATITAKSTNNNKTATCIVTVTGISKQYQYRLKNGLASNYLKAESNASGANVGVAELDVTLAALTWKLERAADATYRLKSSLSNKYLKAEGPASGATVVVAELDTTSAAFTWKLEMVSDATYRLKNGLASNYLKAESNASGANVGLLSWM